MVTANLFSLQVPLSPIPSDTSEKRRNHVATITVAPITHIWKRSPAARFQLSDTRSLRINEVDTSTGYSQREQQESLKLHPKITRKNHDEFQVPGKSAAPSNTANSIVADNAGGRVVMPSATSVESKTQHNPVNQCCPQERRSNKVQVGRRSSAINPLYPYVVERMEWPKPQPSIRQHDEQLRFFNQDWARRKLGADDKPCHARTVFVDESIMKVHVLFDQDTRQTSDKPVTIEASTSTSATGCEERSVKTNEPKRRSMPFNKQRQSETRRARYCSENLKNSQTTMRAARNCRSSYASYKKDQEGLVRGCVETVQRRKSPERRGKFDKVTQCRRTSHDYVSAEQPFKLASPRRTSRMECEQANKTVSDSAAYRGKVSETFDKQRRADSTTSNTAGSRVVGTRRKRSFPSQEDNPGSLPAGMKRTHTRHPVCKSPSYRPNRQGESQRQLVPRVVKAVPDLCQKRVKGVHLITKRVRQLNIGTGKKTNLHQISGKMSALSGARKKSHDKRNMQSTNKADGKVVDWINASKRIQRTSYGTGVMTHDDVNTIRKALEVGCNNNASVYSDGSYAQYIGLVTDFAIGNKQLKGKHISGNAPTSSKYRIRQLDEQTMSPFDEAYIKLREMCTPRTEDATEPKAKPSRTRSARGGGRTKVEKKRCIGATIGSGVQAMPARRQQYAKKNARPETKTATPMEPGSPELKTIRKSTATIPNRSYPGVSSGLEINHNAKSRPGSNIAGVTITGKTVFRKGMMLSNGITKMANTQRTKRNAEATIYSTSNCRQINASNSRKKGNNHAHLNDASRHVTPSAYYRKLHSVRGKVSSCNVVRLNIKLARRQKQDNTGERCHATGRSTGKGYKRFEQLLSNDTNTSGVMDATGSDLQQLVPAGARAMRCQAVSPLPRPHAPKMQKTESAHNKIHCVNMKKPWCQKRTGAFDGWLPTFVRNGSTSQAGNKPIGTWSFWGGSVSQDLTADVSVLYNILNGKLHFFKPNRLVSATQLEHTKYNLTNLKSMLLLPLLFLFYLFLRNKTFNLHISTIVVL